MYEKMNNSAAFQAWTLLFTDDIYKTWDTEINEDLRPLSMLMCSIKHEMKSIQTFFINSLINCIKYFRNSEQLGYICVKIT